MGRPAGEIWSVGRDSVLRRLRAEGRSWQDIGLELGVNPDIARERGRRIGATAPGHIPRSPVEDVDRPALPPGHPRSWGMLTAGTLFADQRWPGWETASRWA